MCTVRVGDFLWSQGAVKTIHTDGPHAMIPQATHDGVSQRCLAACRAASDSDDKDFTFIFAFRVFANLTRELRGYSGGRKRFETVHTTAAGWRTQYGQARAFGNARWRVEIHFEAALLGWR